MQLDKKDAELLKRNIRALANRPGFLSMDRYLQHGDTSCLWHSIAVAYYSLRIASRLGLNCDRESMVRGALLHDYFLYDWHEPSGDHRLHGFFHPRAALNNAERDYELNDVERGIILRHMFPLTLIPPNSTEAVVVCLADKFCSTRETLQRHTSYAGLRSFCAT